MKRHWRVLPFAAIFALAACASQTEAVRTVEEPGFLMGLVHGFIVLFALVASWFTEARIYAVPNGGVWYDLGYVIGIMFFFGGGGRASQ